MNEDLYEGLDYILKNAQQVYEAELQGIFFLLGSAPNIIESDLFDMEVKLDIGRVTISTIPELEIQNFQIKLYGKHAFLASRNLKKGDAILAVGEMNNRFEMDDFGYSQEIKSLVIDKKGFFRKIKPKSQLHFQESISFEPNLVPEIPVLNGEIIIPPEKRN